MTTTAVPQSPPVATRGNRAAWVGLAGAVLLVLACVYVPRLTGWHVVQSYHDSTWPPLHGDWWPHTGPGTVPTILLALLATVFAERAARTIPWLLLLPLCYGVGVLWIVALARIDPGDGEITNVLNENNEYLGTARRTTDISQTLHEYISRIPNSAEHVWPVHVAGHPPGALLFFVGLVRLGLSNEHIGYAVVLIAATTALAVMCTLRALGQERLARVAAPFLVLTPAATTMGVSADAMFAAVVAWGLCLMAVAATRRSRTAMAAWAVAAGLVLGYSVFLSYGLPLAGVMALGVLVAARSSRRGGAWSGGRGSWWPLPVAVAAAVVVVAVFASAGFSWWKAYPVLSDRYWDPNDIAVQRPQAYWLFGDLGALLLTAGPMLGAGFAIAVTRWRELWRDASTRVVLALAGSTALVVLAADLSRMSKAEVERIWLPFMPWLTLSLVLLPPRWRRWGLLVQLATAVLVQSFVNDTW